ncbi:MAG: zinc-ribbon domain-containing protein, partial [Oscillospiraceae bacterium]|nr:zinc-ribbon domain-containing protein [Oscillospiraceae bacterium]
MPKCSKCGAEISVDSKFCPECGEKVEITEQIQTDIPPLPEIKPITDIAKDTEKEDKKDFGADENLENKEDTVEKPESAAEAVTVNVEETRQELEKALEDIPEIKKIDGVTEEEKPSDIPPMPPKPVLDAKARRVQIEETARNVQKATDLRNKALSMDLDEPAKPQKPKRKAPVWLIVGLCLIAAAIAVTVLLPVLTPRQQTDTAAVTTVSETAATTSAAETTVTTTVTTTETTVTTTETTVTTTSAASSSETSAATSASGDVSD